jgi:hypothetical protein
MVFVPVRAMTPLLREGMLVRVLCLTFAVFLRAILLSWLALAAAHAAPDFLGTWSGEANGNPLTVTFAADGSGTANGEPLRWQRMGGLLFIEQAGEVLAYQVQVQGDAMTVIGGEFVAGVQLKRGKAAARPQAAAPLPTKPVIVSGGSRAGAELVGKWCKGGSFSANSGGGSSSSTCFELRADGSYSYAHEGSVSAYGGGYYGATASQDSDSGRWTSGANTLTAQSQRGTVTTYQIEKRNHPSTRDPMLCLNGECYVTYWQKAPW